MQADSERFLYADKNVNLLEPHYIKNDNNNLLMKKNIYLYNLAKSNQDSCKPIVKLPITH